MERPVSDKEKALLRHKLLSYKYSLTDQTGLSIMESKKISNDQEPIQSDPISCPQNQKGNN